MKIIYITLIALQNKLARSEFFRILGEKNKLCIERFYVPYAQKFDLASLSLFYYQEDLHGPMGDLKLDTCFNLMEREDLLKGLQEVAKIYELSKAHKFEAKVYCF